MRVFIKLENSGHVTELEYPDDAQVNFDTPIRGWAQIKHSRGTASFNLFNLINIDWKHPK